MITDVRFAGVGGQGAVTAGQLLAEAAAIDGRFATQTEAYAAIIRGGHAASNIRISDDPVVFPWVIRADYLVAMHQRALNANLGDLKSGGVLVIDPVLVTSVPEPIDARVYRVPILQLAQKAGRNVVGNVVALAVLARISGLVSADAVKKAVLNHVPRGTEELNRRAVEIGFSCDLQSQTSAEVTATKPS